MTHSKTFIACFLFMALLLQSCHTATYGTMVCGDIYMTNGTRTTAAGNDRLRLPLRHGDITVTADIYGEARQKSEYSYSDVDSIRVWHPASPGDIWTMIPLKGYGWCMRYVENPYITVYTYSSRGYSVFASGRMANNYTQRIFSQSKVHILMAKPGESVSGIGSISGYGGMRWCERLCTFVADDPELCKVIKQAKRRKFETLKLLANYKVR